mmetsp:Transcript_16502/g.36564  ORF Transcript_16502/g.36564 Transcript_16502/m.36564 type:complete len:361 (-) Transcript_16502:577-1659(-)
MAMVAAAANSSALCSATSISTALTTSFSPSISRRSSAGSGAVSSAGSQAAVSGAPSFAPASAGGRNAFSSGAPSLSALPRQGGRYTGAGGSGSGPYPSVMYSGLLLSWKKVLSSNCTSLDVSEIGSSSRSPPPPCVGLQRGNNTLRAISGVISLSPRCTLSAAAAMMAAFLSRACSAWLGRANTIDDTEAGLCGSAGGAGVSSKSSSADLDSCACVCPAVGAAFFSICLEGASSTKARTCSRVKQPFSWNSFSTLPMRSCTRLRMSHWLTRATKRRSVLSLLAHTSLRFASKCGCAVDKSTRAVSAAAPAFTSGCVGEKSAVWSLPCKWRHSDRFLCSSASRLCRKTTLTSLLESSALPT